MVFCRVVKKRRYVICKRKTKSFESSSFVFGGIIYEGQKFINQSEKEYNTYE